MYNVKLTMTITNPDDPKFHSNYVLDYSNMSYDTMVAMQEAVSNALVGLGKASAAMKKTA